MSTQPSVHSNPYRNQMLAVMALGLLSLLAVLCAIFLRWYWGPPLSFRTISQYPYAGGLLAGGLIAYDQFEPALFVITQPSEIDEFVQSGLRYRTTYPEQVQAITDEMRTVDYDRYFVILALRGYADVESRFNITSITRRGTTVRLWAEFYDPPHGWGRGVLPVVISPFHLLQVPKEGEWGEEIYFVLMKGLQSVAETTRFVP